tara:strand:+ start:459 stop:1073 length:615 start_codon:yes stop_codon:yes gene_type:complete
MASTLKVNTIAHSGGTAAMALDSSGNITESNKEYFRVDLTTSQTGIAEDSEATVDFGGSGTVIYDTKSKFDSGNDAYLLGSDGLYLITFSCSITSDAINTEEIHDAGAQIEVATDGSTYLGLFGASMRTNDIDDHGVGSVHLSNSIIYKSTNLTTKIRLRVQCDLSDDSDTYEVRKDVDANMQATTFSTSNSVPITFMTVTRIG